MSAMLRTAGFVALVVSAVLIGEQRPGFAQSTSFDDTARFLAGMPPSEGSALAPLTQDPAWQQHARYFNSAFGNVDKNQFSKVRAWSSAKLTTPHQVLFYFFSGPDFLYANAFFPNESTYVMVGLEPVGPVPDLLRLPRGSLDDALRHIEGSLSTILTISFFKTHDMRMTLGASSVSGTLPILYVFLARSGKTIHDVTLIKLDDQGVPQPESAPSPPSMKNPAHGVKIVFADEDGREKTLYYFGTNVAGAGFKSSGLEKFCDRLGSGDVFIKSASYLLHGNGFSDVRNFLLQHATLVLQDDTGIPVSYLSSDKWELHPFGRYTGPITMFARNYQPRLTQLFQSGAEPLSFGLGYQWRVLGSNLLLATRTGSGTEPISNQAGASLDGKPLASTNPDDSQPSSAASEPANPATKKASKKAQRQQRANSTVVQQASFWPFFWGRRY